MSGIFVDFRTAGFEAADRTAFAERVAARSTRIGSEPIDHVAGPRLCAAASHHGLLRTGGAAGDDASCLVAWGSAWIRPEDTVLASPSELLAHFEATPWRDRSALGGSFAVAHYRDAERELVIESEFLGAAPLYYREQPGRLTVASELKFLVEPGHEQVDPEALTEMLGMGFLPRPHTLVKGIRRMPGNSRLVYGPDGLRIEPFPSVEYDRSREVTDDVIDEYDALVRRYLKRFEGVASRYCISISGGLDSRLLAAAALREGWQLDPFTVGEAGNLDVRMADRMCRKMGLSLKRYEVRGETLGDWFARALWFTEGRVLPEHMHYMPAQFAGEVPKGPQLHGLDGEAVMGGHFDNPTLVDATAEERREACLKLCGPANYWPAGTREAVYGADRKKETDAAGRIAAKELFARMGFTGTYSDAVDFRFRLKGEAFMSACILGQALPWSDVIDPFIDPDAFRFGASLQLGGIAERQGQIRWGLRHLPVIGELPRVKAGVLLDIRDPDPEAYRRASESLMRKARLYYLIGRLSRGRINLTLKATFPEYGTWYRRFGSVRNFVDGVLLSEQTLDRGLFRREGLIRLLGDLRGGRNVWGAVSSCLMLEILLRQFIEGSDVPDDPVSPFGAGR